MRVARIISFFLALLLILPVNSFVLTKKAHAVAPLRLGIMSDSSADEYRGDDARASGTAYEGTTLNWVELMVKYRGLDVGPWGSRAEPRRIGYEYNWAKSGAEAGTLISSGQHTGMASQVSQGLVDAVYFSIGGNDFAYYRDGAGIYNGTIAGTQLTNKINAVVANITTALDTVLAANPNIKVLMATIPDMGNSPIYQGQFPDPVKRQKVTDAINTANAGIVALANTRPTVSIIDNQQLTNTILALIDPQTLTMTLAGEAIHFDTYGDEPHNGTLSDAIHAGTVFEGVLANLYMDIFNQRLGTSFVPFTDTEKVVNAGILPASASNLTKQIAVGSDDVHEDGSTFSSNATSIAIGSYPTYYAGFRFTNVTIPQGSTIYQAAVEVYEPSDAWIGIGYQSYAENSGNSAAFSSSNRPSARSATNSITWVTNNTHWLPNTWQKLDPVSASIQEVVNRPDWQSGNAISVITRGTGSQFARKFIRSYEGNAAQAPRLVVSFVPGVSPTPSPTPAPTVTPSPTATLEPSVSPSPTLDPSPTATPVATPSPTIDPSPSATPEPSVSPTPEPSVSPSPTLEPSVSPSATPDISPSPSATPEPSVSPSATLDPSPSATPDASPSPSIDPSPSATPEASPSPTPQPSPSPTIDPSPSATPEPSVSPTPEPSVSPSATLEPTPSATPDVSVSPSIDPSPSVSPDPSPSPTPDASPSPTPQPSPSPTIDPSPSPTIDPSPSATPEPTVSPTLEPSVSPSATPEVSPSPSATLEPSASPSPTLDPSPSATPEPSVSPTPEPSVSPSPTLEPSVSPSATPDISPSPSATPEPSVSPSPTPVVTPTPTPEPSVSPSPTLVPTPSPSPSATPSPTLVPSPTASPSVSPSPTPSASPVTRVVELRNRPNNSTQKYLIVDGIIENGSVQTEATSSRFTYSTGWTTLPTSGVNGSPARFSVTNGNYVRVTTTANSLSLQTGRDVQIGSFDVYINSVFQYTYNANGTPTAFVNIPIF